MGPLLCIPLPSTGAWRSPIEVVECSRSRIFKQVNNGVFVRMAAIKRALWD